jgi:threonine/homoserine/homoserine lactone efflux protein
MPKLLCLGGLVVSVIVLVLFLVNLIMGFAGMSGLFNFRSWLMDIVFIICSALLGYLSWSSFRELR